MHQNKGEVASWRGRLPSHRRKQTRCRGQVTSFLFIFYLIKHLYIVIQLARCRGQVTSFLFIFYLIKYLYIVIQLARSLQGTSTRLFIYFFIWLYFHLLLYNWLARCWGQVIDYCCCFSLIDFCFLFHSFYKLIANSESGIIHNVCLCVSVSAIMTFFFSENFFLCFPSPLQKKIPSPNIFHLFLHRFSSPPQTKYFPS